MTDTSNISDEQISAFIDNQLDDNERAFVLDAIKKHKDVEEKYSQLSRLKEMVALSYNNIPSPSQKTLPPSWRAKSAWTYSIAASLLLLIGAAVGVAFTEKPSAKLSDSFLSLSQFDVSSNPRQKVLIHISTMDQKKVEAALNKAESLLAKNKNRQTSLDLEIVANAQGLGILRDNSLYSKKISSLAEQYSNVSFLACGIAKESAKLKEGNEIKLLPQATEVPAALDQILKRIKLGWLYVRA